MENQMEQPAQHVHKHLYGKDRDVLLARMRRIEGQARGISKMIEDDRYCPDIIQQLIAMTSAAREVSFLLLEDHIHGCVTDAIKNGGGDETVEELIGVVRRAART
jgi:DNA-binding FrmR family transcriptional regulator